MKKKLFPLLLFTLICQCVFGQKLIKKESDYMGFETQRIILENDFINKIRDFIKGRKSREDQELQEAGKGYIVFNYDDENDPGTIGSYELVEYYTKPDRFDRGQIPLYYTIVDDFPVIIYLRVRFARRNASLSTNSERILHELVDNRCIKSRRYESVGDLPPYKISERYYEPAYYEEAQKQIRLHNLGKTKILIGIRPETAPVGDSKKEAPVPLK